MATNPNVSIPPSGSPRHHTKQREVGFGYTSHSIEGTDAPSLYGFMKDKALHPEKYIPVHDVYCEPRGERVFRHMVRPDKSIIEENMYFDEMKMRIRFVVLSPDGVETGLAHVNALAFEPLRIEYYCQNAAGERVFWHCPLQVAIDAIDITVKRAGGHFVNDNAEEIHEEKPPAPKPPIGADKDNLYKHIEGRVEGGQPREVRGTLLSSPIIGSQ